MQVFFCFFLGAGGSQPNQVHKIGSFVLICGSQTWKGLLCPNGIQFMLEMRRSPTYVAYVSVLFRLSGSFRNVSCKIPNNSSSE